MSRYNRSPFKTPTHTGGATESAYLKLFPKNFIRPYGLAIKESDISDVTIGSRLWPSNCPWLRKPQVAGSELAATVALNVNPAREYLQAFDEVGAYKYIGEIECLGENLKGMNLLGENTGNVQEAKEAYGHLLRFLKDDEQMCSVEVAALLGGTLYTTAINLLAAKHCLGNVEWMAEMAKQSPDQYAAPEFKKWLDNFGAGKTKLKHFLGTAVYPHYNKAGTASPGGAGGTFLERFQAKRRKVQESSSSASSSSDEEEKARRERKRQKKEKKRRKRVVESSPESSPERTPEKTKKTRKRASEVAETITHMPVATTQKPLEEADDQKEESVTPILEKIKKIKKKKKKQD